MTRLARKRLSSSEPPGILDLDTRFYANANRLVTLLDNHDLRARIKTEILDAHGHWDRHRGNRILKLCLSFLFTTRGIPQLYYGTEIGMEGRADPDNRRDMRWEVFDPDFTPEPGDAEYRDAQEIFEHTRALIGIRRENEALRFGYLFTLYVDHFIYAYMRSFRDNTLIAVINNGLAPMPVPLSIEIDRNPNIPSRIRSSLAAGSLRNLLRPEQVVHCRDGRIEVLLEGKEAAIFKHLPS
jgi:alpha-amylase